MPLHVLWYLISLLALTHQGAATGGTVGGGVIIGHVSDGTNDQRIGNAVVTIAGGGLIAPEKLSVDTDGQFVARGLAPGVYTLTAKRGGYLDSAFGVRRPNGQQRTLYLDENERRDNIVLLMFKAAAVTGRVTDTDNNPIADAPVLIYRRTFSGGRPTLALVDEGATNASGDYAIGKLGPGDYVVAAPMPLSASVSGPVRDGGAPMSSAQAATGSLKKYATTYHPFARVASGADVVTLNVGQVRQSVDIQVERQPVVSISGRVTVRGVLTHVQLDLVAAGEDDIGGNRPMTSTIAMDSGSFTFSAVPPGDYILRAFQLGTGADSVPHPEWAEQLVSIGDKGVSDITLFMRAGAAVRGRIDLDGSVDDANAWASGFTLFLDPASAPRYPTPPANATAVSVAAKTFAIGDVLPGRYLVRATAGGGRAVKAVMYQGRDVSQTSFAVERGDLGGFVVVLTDRVTELTGSVTGAANLDESRVLVFPLDPRAWLDAGTSPTTIRVIDVTFFGTFEANSLPAGDYLIAAFDQDTAVDWQNPAFLQAVAPKATRIRLGAGERQIADLKVITVK